MELLKECSFVVLFQLLASYCRCFFPTILKQQIFVVGCPKKLGSMASNWVIIRLIHRGILVLCPSNW